MIEKISTSIDQLRTSQKSDGFVSRQQFINEMSVLNSDDFYFYVEHTESLYNQVLEISKEYEEGYKEAVRYYQSMI